MGLCKKAGGRHSAAIGDGILFTHPRKIFKTLILFIFIRKMNKISVLKKIFFGGVGDEFPIQSLN